MLRTAGFASIVFLATIGFAPAQEDAPGKAAPGKAAQANGVQQPAAAGKVTATGTLKFQVALKASSSLPDGTSISISAGASYVDPNYTNVAAVYPPATTVAGGKVSTTVEVPYKWVLSDRKGKLSIFVNVSSGLGTDDVYDTSSFTENLAIPANGAVTTVHVTGTI